MRSTSILLLVSIVGCGGASQGAASSDSSPDAAGGGDARTDGSQGDAGRDGDASSSGPPSADGGMSSADGGAPVLRKRGIAYGSNSAADLAALSAGIGWWYNWSPSPDSTLPKGYAAPVEFVPMIWGGTFDTTQLATQVPAGAKYLLTFNEPNFGAQSNLTPQQAAALWPQIEAFATSRNLEIVSPALNYCGGTCNETTPFDWLDAFFAACAGCRVDYIAAHWYSCTKGALQTYLSDYETRYPQPLWLTEFSCLDNSLAPTDANEAAYMNDALTLLESDPRVFRYSWFTGRYASQPAIDLLGADGGTLTALGQGYVAFP